MFVMLARTARRGGRGAEDARDEIGSHLVVVGGRRLGMVVVVGGGRARFARGGGGGAHGSLASAMTVIQLSMYLDCTHNVITQMHKPLEP